MPIELCDARFDDATTTSYSSPVRRVPPLCRFVSKRVFGILCGFYLLTGCGGKLAEDTTQASGSSRVPLSQFLQRMTEAVCNNVKNCCAILERAADGQCKQYVAQIWQPLLDHASAVHAKYNDSEAARCVDAYRRAWTECADLKRSNLHLGNACLALFSAPAPLSPIGGPCNFTLDCNQPERAAAFCVTLSNRDGYCQKQVPTQLFATCVSSTQEQSFHCPDDAVCDIDGTCQLRHDLGDLCGVGPSDNCQQLAVCDRAATGSCIQAKPIGDTCNSPSDCENFACRNGHCVPLLDATMLSSLYCH